MRVLSSNSTCIGQCNQYCYRCDKLSLKYMKSINLVAIIVIITKKCERLWLVFEGRHQCCYWQKQDSEIKIIWFINLNTKLTFVIWTCPKSKKNIRKSLKNLRKINLMINGKLLILEWKTKNADMSSLNPIVSTIHPNSSLTNKSSSNSKRN